MYKKKTNKISTRKMERTEQGLLEEKYIELGIQDKYRYIVAEMRRAVEFATYGKKRACEGRCEEGK